MPAAAATALVPATVVAPSAPGGGGDGQVADGELGHVVGGGQAGQLGVVEADDQLAADHADGGRHRAVVADRLLDLAGHPQVVGPGQAVRDDRALQGHDRAARRASAAATSRP